MSAADNNQLEKLLSDIASIKLVIRRNQPLLQKILIPTHFRWFGLMAAMANIIYSLMIYYLVNHYGSFGDIPPTIRYLLYGSAAVIIILFQLFKQKIFLASVKDIDPAMTFGNLLKEIFTFRILHIYVPIVALMLILGIYFAYQQCPRYIVPTIAIGLGLLTNFLGGMIEIKPYLILGYWLVVTGLLTILFSFVPALIAFAVSIGGGMLLLAILGSLSKGFVEEE
jgi:hypothetical protein